MLRDDLLHIATLARLDPDSDTLDKFARQCSDILNYMDVLAEVDTENVEPLYSPVDHEGVFRQDVVGASVSHKEILDNAPETDGDFFVVPRII